MLNYIKGGIQSQLWLVFHNLATQKKSNRFIINNLMIYATH